MTSQSAFDAADLFRHVSAEKARFYRCIMDVFAAALDQLAAWGNLESQADTARAHGRALIREFDLDFVITSERAWACYAERPGVAICQLRAFGSSGSSAMRGQPCGLV